MSEMPADTSRAQQLPRGLLQGGEVRDFFQAKNRAEVRQLGQDLTNAAVVGLEKGLENQASELLGLSESLWTVTVRVIRKGCRSYGQSLTGNPQGGPARNAHAPILRC